MTITGFTPIAKKTLQTSIVLLLTSLAGCATNAFRGTSEPSGASVSLRTTPVGYHTVHNSQQDVHVDFNAVETASNAPSSGAAPAPPVQRGRGITFSNVPTRAEMDSKTIPQVLQDHPDFKKLHRSAWRYPFLGGSAPPVGPLTDAWGEPQSRIFCWWSFLSFPNFSTWYIWSFSNTEARVFVTRPSSLGYASVVGAMRLQDKNKGVQQDKDHGGQAQPR